MNHENNFTLLDRTPWLSLTGAAKYLDYKSTRSVHRFIKKYEDTLIIKRIGIKLRIKQSSIDRALEEL